MQSCRESAQLAVDSLRNFDLYRCGRADDPKNDGQSQASLDPAPHDAHSIQRRGKPPESSTPCLSETRGADRRRQRLGTIYGTLRTCAVCARSRGERRKVLLRGVGPSCPSVRQVEAFLYLARRPHARAAAVASLAWTRCAVVIR